MTKSAQLPKRKWKNQFEQAWTWIASNTDVWKPWLNYRTRDKNYLGEPVRLGVVCYLDLALKALGVLGSPPHIVSTPQLLLFLRFLGPQPVLGPFLAAEPRKFYCVLLVSKGLLRSLGLLPVLGIPRRVTKEIEWPCPPLEDEAQARA